MVTKLKRILDKNALQLVRIALGLVFLYFAWDKVQAPEATAFMMQNSMMSIMMPTSNATIYLIALVETIIGFCLVLKIHVQKIALLAAVLLAGIIFIAKMPQDFVLFFLAIYLSTTDETKVH